VGGGWFLNFQSTTGETEVRIKRLADFLCTGASQIFYTHEFAGFFILLSKISTLRQDAYIFLNYIQTRRENWNKVRRREGGEMKKNKAGKQ
jgi:hypothetical protein